MTSVAVLSHLVIDEVSYPDQRPAAVAVGGAGAYAAVGASLASAAGPPLLVSGVGRADHIFLADWCTRRQISSAGLFPVGEYSPRTRIQYFADGGREEVPVYGLGHFDAHTPLPRHIRVGPECLGGVYLFHNHDLGYWDEVAQFRRTFSGPLLWEVSSDSCRLEHRDAVWDRFQAVDILSVNEAEAFALLGTADLATAIGELRHAGLTVLLRRGANGSLVLNKGEVYAVGTAPTQAQDPTGGGNSYSGAFLAAYAHTGELGCAARTAAAAASVVVAAPGSPEVGATIRQSVEDAATGVSFDRC